MNTLLYNKCARSLAALLMLAVSVGVQARHFYDTKSNILGITGNIEVLTGGNPNNSKFVANPIDVSKYAVFGSQAPTGKPINGKATEQAMNNAKVGKMVLNYLFMRTDDGKMSEDRLKERAVKNAQLADYERAQAGLIDASTIVREDYINILKNNYIFLAEKTVLGDDAYYNWVVLHVEIDQKTQDDVFAAWDDPARYDQIDVKVRLVSTGTSKMKSYNNVLRSVAKTDDAFAIRSAVLKDPYHIEIGSNDGLKRGDRMAIYRQKQAKDGTYYSTRIGRSRAATDFNRSSTGLVGISGSTGSEKKGDFAVLSPDLNWSHAVFYGIKDQNVTYGYMTEFKGMTLLPRFIFKAAVGEYKDDQDKLYAINGGLYHSPRTYQIAAGFGKDFHMLSRIDLMPYATLGYTMLLFKGYEKDPYKTSNTSVGGLEVAGGIRLAVNILYPLQVFGGAEYQYGFSVGNQKADGSSSVITWNDMNRGFFDVHDWSISGLNIYAGVRIVL